MTQNQAPTQPEFSVVLVSDRLAGDQKSWDYLRGTLQALARQTYTGSVEYLLVENETIAQQAPADVVAILPSLRVLKSPSSESCGLKNHGVLEARAEIIVILDADCRPAPDWMLQIASAWRKYPDAAVISGRTDYPGRSTMERLLALLSRAYVDRGGAGDTRYTSNNNSSWRRKVYLTHPFPEQLGPFANRIQSEAVIRDGGRLLFVPEISVIHEFEGWSMELDLRNNCGYGAVITRLADVQIPYAWLIRMGLVSIPLIVAGKTLDTWKDSLRCWRYFRLRFYELPLAILLAPIVVALEVPGMLAAFGNRSIGQTEWR
jgi:glycosyltransferase involved in cell wall biosynthesis